MDYNILITSGESIIVAVGETYTIKDNELFLNNSLYKKKDLEIAIAGSEATNPQTAVTVGIKKRDPLGNLPADLKKYTEWKINGTVPTSLGQLVENINTSFQ